MSDVISIVREINDYSLTDAIAIYQRNGVFEEYYMELYDENLCVRPMDDKTLDNLKAIFAGPVQKKRIVFSFGNILYCDTECVVWKTMTAEEGMYAFHCKEEHKVKDNLLWAYYLGEVFIFEYKVWKQKDTLVMNALLPNVMGDGSICQGTAKFPSLNGDLIEFCKECENIYATSIKGGLRTEKRKFNGRKLNTILPCIK